ncbi:cation diffusion facilitator family transporter [Woodsholea maritima]|uniref:cation diffusion facilitator family transporter n=1 Tax=Woodsholea maritima TaxID=240237 RepID=UPI0003715710|nr:cation diffusion facilitator family transporter [Woodsholea maritima]
MAHDGLEAGPGRVAPQEAQKISAHATRLSVIVASILVVAKIGAWWLSGSVAMLASLADSALDLAASLTAFFAVRYAATPADEEHRHGHGKAEAMASFLQGLLVAGSAAYLVYESGKRLINPEPIQHGLIALGVMVLSIVMTLGLVWAQTQALKKSHSLAVSGDRAHYMADLGSNLAVMVGLIGAGLLGFTRADPIIGLLVALWLFKTAWDVITGAADHLMDKELPDEEREAILRLAREDAQVLGVHNLRTRAAGPFVHIQIHMDLDPTLTLDEAHKIIVAAEKRIMSAFPAADILIHPDPRGHAEPHGNDLFDQQTGSESA